MQLQLTDEQRAFQKEVRTFVEEKLPAEIRTKPTVALPWTARIM